MCTDSETDRDTGNPHLNKTMKSAYIFMNHHIRKQDSQEPFIAIQHDKQRIYANRVHIDGPSTVCTGLLAEIETHEVKAWIECDYSDVTVLE